MPFLFYKVDTVVGNLFTIIYNHFILLVRTKYIAYYYFSPKGAGADKVDDMNGYGMGMAIWGVRPVDMSDEAESKTMEENYEKLKKSAEASMNSFISLQEYWKLGK